MTKRALNKRPPVKPAKKAVARKTAREVDIAALELGYRTTHKTLEQLGAEQGISRARVCQIAKEHGWSRGDMQQQVRARAEAKVAAVVTRVEQGTEEAVDASAALMADTILRERRDVRRLMQVADQLLQEVEDQGKPKPGRKPKDAPALPVRIDNLRKLGDTMTRLITLERGVLGIETGAGAGEAAAIAAAAASAATRVALDFSEVVRQVKP